MVILLSLRAVFRSPTAVHLTLISPSHCFNNSLCGSALGPHQPSVGFRNPLPESACCVMEDRPLQPELYDCRPDISPQ